DSSYPPLTYAYVEKINRTVYVIFEGDSKTKRKSLSYIRRDVNPESHNNRYTTDANTSIECICNANIASGSTAGLAAGLSVSLVVIIIVTVIVMVFLKRRGLLTKCFKQNDEKSNHTEDTATEIACISTPIFEFTTNIVDDLTATNHSYFVLEKTFDEETKEETEHYAEPDMTDVDHYDLTDESQKDTENDYDTTNDKKSSVKAGLAKPNN
ncbi:hypothetical protein MAR_014402, partial [Mya arenaria]